MFYSQLDERNFPPEFAFWLSIRIQIILIVIVGSIAIPTEAKIDDMQLLCKYHIGTAEELSAFRKATIQKIHALAQERNGIYNKIRRATEPTKTELKEQAKAISQQIAPLRKELKCDDRIWD